MTRTLIIAAAITFATQAASAQTFSEARVDSIVRAEMERQNIPGLAGAVIRKNQPLLVKGYGVANVEHRVPVTPETIFQSGSVGKQFTSALIMLLVQDGKLKLDDSIRRHLPDAPADWEPITIRHLLTHTSGIPDYTTETFDYRKDFTEAELTKLSFGVTREFAPGSRWNYSNTGYVLLGIIAGKVGGKFYGDQLVERVFKPIGMNTARIITESDIVPNRAAGYYLEDGVLKNQTWIAPALNTTADGSVYVSLNDMIAWDRALRAGAVLDLKSWQQVYEPVRLTSGNRYPYGFGWFVDSIGGQTRIQHNGAWQGFKADISRFLGDDMTIIVLANAAQGNPTLITNRIAASINPAISTPAPKAMADTEPAQTAKLRGVLDAVARGELKPADFAYVRAGFFPGAANHYTGLLKDAGALQRVVVLSRRTLGDDRISSYEAHFEKGVYLASLGVAPDGKISTFSLRPKPQQP